MRHTRHFGVSRHARILGVSVGHLSLVLSGARKSESLERRYRDLLSREGEAGPLSKHREVVEAGVIAAETLTPIFRAANCDRGRRVIRAELAAKLPPDFWLSVEVIRERMPIAELRRFQAAFSPFFSLFFSEVLPQ